MIKTGELLELLKLVLFSGYIENERPLSVMLVGNVGIGKTEVLQNYKESSNIAFLTDVTYMGLINLLEEQKELRHLIIPDFLKITMKKQSTAENFISCLNALTEEGLSKISLFGMSKDFKGKRAGVITATTKDSYAQHKKKWASMGFSSRILIVSYDYSDATRESVFEFIQNRKYITSAKEPFSLPTRNVAVTFSPELAKKLRSKDSTFRSQKQLQTLAMSSALERSLTAENVVVTDEDIQRVKRLSKFFNLKFTKI